MRRFRHNDLRVFISVWILGDREVIEFAHSKCVLPLLVPKVSSAELVAARAAGSSPLTPISYEEYMKSSLCQLAVRLQLRGDEAQQIIFWRERHPPRFH